MVNPPCTRAHELVYRLRSGLLFSDYAVFGAEMNLQAL